MNIRVLFFASLRDAVGVEKVEIELEQGIPLERLMEKLSSHLPAEGVQALAAENVRVAVNQALISGSAEILPGDEVAFLPPVTGG